MNSRKVLMMGVAPDEQGGVSTLVRQIICKASEDDSIELRYLSTTNNGGACEKVGLSFAALVGEREALTSGYDIVHIHMANNASFLRAGVFSRVAAGYGAKIVLQIHCDLARFYETAPALLRRSIDAALQVASKIIVMGGYLDGFLEDRGVEREDLSS